MKIKTLTWRKISRERNLRIVFVTHGGLKIVLWIGESVNYL